MDSFNGNSIEPPNRAARLAGGQGDAPTATRSIFDYELCLSRLGGDRELFDEILDIFLEDAPKSLEQASTSLANGDWVTLERATHTLKGLSANFAAVAAVAAAYTVELHARERRRNEAANCFAQMETELHRLEVALRDFRQQRS